MTITAEAPVRRQSAGDGLNKEHYTARGLLVEQIRADAREQQEWLTRVRTFVIQERVARRASYCGSGLNDFLRKFDLPTSDYPEGSQAPDQLASDFHEEHWSTAGLRAIRAAQQEKFAAVRRDVRAEAIKAHQGGYSSAERLTAFLQEFGLDPAVRRPRITVNLYGSFVLPEGTVLPTRSSEQRAWVRSRIEQALGEAYGAADISVSSDSSQLG